jgi:Flp pilus assembly protein TadG
MKPAPRLFTVTSEDARRARVRPRSPLGKRGQSTVEFALIVLPLFIIIFAIIDYAQIFFYENALQNAMREASRFATSGAVIQATNSGVAQFDTNNGVAVPKAINDSEGREASRYACIRYFFQSNCVIFMATNAVQVTSATALPGAPPVTSTNSSNNVVLMEATGVAANDGPGGANDYVQVTATYTLHTLTPLFGMMGAFQRGTTHGINYYPVRVSAIVKNEPALQNFEHTNMYPDEAP